MVGGLAAPREFGPNATANLVQNQSVSLSDAVTARSDTTHVSHDIQHGTQVSYSTADGRIYLWYPGNPQVLQGRWQACEYSYTVRTGGAFGGQALATYGIMCFEYGPGTFNPATKRSGDNWECGPAGALQRRSVEARSGDVFGLATRTAVPGQLSIERVTIAELQAKLGKR